MGVIQMNQKQIDLIHSIMVMLTMLGLFIGIIILVMEL